MLFRSVRPPNPEAQLSALSGGNQQKAVVAREVDCQPQLLVAVQPTRGLDFRAVAQVRSKLLEAKERGCGVLLCSLDLEEVLALSDRVYVLFGGRIARCLSPPYDEHEAGRCMLGGS